MRVQDGEAGGPRPAGQLFHVDRYLYTCSEATPRILQVNASDRIRACGVSIPFAVVELCLSYSCRRRSKRYGPRYGKASATSKEVVKDGRRRFSDSPYVAVTTSSFTDSGSFQHSQQERCNERRSSIVRLCYEAAGVCVQMQAMYDYS
jgi:hypothetical protein